MPDVSLIQLPIGTPKRGLNLAPPHGYLIWSGRKTSIAKAKPFDLSGPWILVSGGKAYGTMQVGLPRVVGVKEFDQCFDSHRVTTGERQTWWAEEQTLYLSEITDFKGFQRPWDIKVFPGMQTVVEQVEFAGSEPEHLDEHYETVRLVIEQKVDETTIALPKSTEPDAVTVTSSADFPDGATTVMDVALIEKIEEPFDVEHTLLAVSKQEEPMPYSAENPPEAIAKLPAAAQRIWIATYNSANEKYPGNEVRCNKIAWGAVKNAGYYQDEGGAWHKKEAEEAVTQRVCACPECGTEAEQQAGVPCTEIECPKCSTPMIGRVKEAWDTAYVNKLSDECFLHIEDGGEKDSEGKTVPRSLRHLPYKNEADQVDLPRLRNALSRLGQAATGEDWLSESLRKQLVAKAEALLEKHREKEVNTEPEPARPDDWASPKAEVQQKDSGGVLGWLRQRFDGLLGDLKGIEQLKQDTEPLPVQVGFKTFRAKDGKPWLLTWTTNSFRDREGEIFETKAIEDFVERHAADERKGEFWFWHLPGAKFGEIKWQATVGRFLVESGPFDNTPIGQKFYEFFSQHPQEHPALAPEGWGTSHGYYYGPQDLRDGVYSWFEKFETTVLPKSKASNQHSPGMEVLAMNAEQRKALEVVGGTELAEQIEQLGADRTKELEERGIAFKEAETPQPVVDAPVKTETKDVPAEVEGGETATEAEPVAEPVVDSKAKGVQELAQQIVAGLNLGGLAQAIKGLQESVQSMDTRLKSLEDIGQDEGLSPLIPMPQSAFWRATQMAQTETKETVVKAAAPTLPDAIAQMAKLVPIA